MREDRCYVALLVLLLALVAAGVVAMAKENAYVRSNCRPTGQERSFLVQMPGVMVGKVFVPGAIQQMVEEEFLCPDGSRRWL